MTYVDRQLREALESLVMVRTFTGGVSRREISKQISDDLEFLLKSGKIKIIDNKKFVGVSK